MSKNTQTHTSYTEKNVSFVVTESNVLLYTVTAIDQLLIMVVSVTE